MQHIVWQYTFSTTQLQAHLISCDLAADCVVEFSLSALIFPLVHVRSLNRSRPLLRVSTFLPSVSELVDSNLQCQLRIASKLQRTRVSTRVRLDTMRQKSSNPLNLRHNSNWLIHNQPDLNFPKMSERETNGFAASFITNCCHRTMTAFSPWNHVVMTQLTGHVQVQRLVCLEFWSLFCNTVITNNALKVSFASKNSSVITCQSKSFKIIYLNAT